MNNKKTNKPLAPKHKNEEEAKPLDKKECNRLFKSYKKLNKIAIAVSGGIDSMALLYLLNRWKIENHQNLDITVLSINHNLRNEAEAEVQFVKSFTVENLNLKKHQILYWEEPKKLNDKNRANDKPHKKPKHINQAQARKARYQLLCEYCHNNNIKHLFTAHTLDDQIETFLLRLSKKSGIFGLASMDERSLKLGINIHRPLLSTKKARLKATLQDANIKWCNDPTNDNTLYARVKIRKNLDKFYDLGLDKDGLYQTILKLKSTKNELENYTNQSLKKYTNQNPEGFAIIDYKNFREDRKYIRREVIKKLIHNNSNKDYPPNLKSIKCLDSSMKNPGFKSASLGGCIIIKNNQNFKRPKIIVIRELRHFANLTMQLSDNITIYDNRYIIKFKHPFFKDKFIKPIGKNTSYNLNKLADEDMDLKSSLMQYDKRIIPTFLGIFDKKNDEMPLIIPHLKWSDNDKSVILGNNFSYKIFNDKIKIIEDDKTAISIKLLNKYKK